MKDLQREILSQVAAGKITAEEGAARLEALDAEPSPAPDALPSPEPTGEIRHVKVTSRFGSTDIIGDPSIAGAVADGPHRARQEGDALVINQSPLTGEVRFGFKRPHPRVAANGVELH